MFGRFWRADPARARSTGGTGLGLSIALEDVRLHGGWLQAWGEPGRGSVFRLTLPWHVGETDRRLTASAGAGARRRQPGAPGCRAGPDSGRRTQDRLTAESLRA